MFRHLLKTVSFCLFLWLFLVVNVKVAQAQYQKIILTSPRPLVVHLFQVDLNDPDLDVLVTPKANLGSTTSQFLSNFDLNVAVNGDEHTNTTSPKGLNASLGDIYSAASSEPTMYISENNQVSFGSPTGAVFNAISGSHTLVINGQVNSKFNSCSKPEYCTLIRARTAVGLTGNNQLLLMVIEEGQSDVSEGVSLVELAQLMINNSVSHAIALDGGGSSSIALAGQGLVSYPSDGNERIVANHLGFCNNCIDPASVTPTPSSVTVTAATRVLSRLANSATGVQNAHPLRPFPNQFTAEEESRSIDDSDLTVYCAQRPTVTQQDIIDKREPTVTLTVQGNLSENFTQFITPLLSITDDSTSDFSLSDLDKSKQYLTDYLEGRAYYEGVTEVPGQISLERLGVFRKLAPLTYQDQLKIAMIKRATGEGLLIEPPPTPGVDCNLNASEVNIPGLISKDSFAGLADRWNSSTNFADECFNDVVATAKGRGVNPAWALYTWLIESGASNYSISVEDFGVHLTDVRGFTSQLDRFLGTVTGTWHNFCATNGQPPWPSKLFGHFACYVTGEFDQSRPDYQRLITNVQSYYNTFVGGIWTELSGGCPLPTGPTDNSCP